MQLAFHCKYLPRYSMRLIYITGVNLVVSRTATFHNKQSTTVPVSVIQMDTKERNGDTGTMRGIAG